MSAEVSRPTATAFKLSPRGLLVHSTSTVYDAEAARPQLADAHTLLSLTKQGAA
jgi:hypothetical protein